MHKRPYTCFVSCRFSRGDNKLIDGLIKLIRAGGFDPYIAKEKRAISPVDKIREAICRCDCLIAILTRDRKLDGTDTYVCSDWVQNEIGMAFILDKPIVAMYEERVDIQGIQRWISDYIQFARGRPLDMLDEFNQALGSLRAEIHRRSASREFTQRQHELRQLASAFKDLPADEIERLSETGIIVSYGRDKTIHALQELVNRTMTGELLFGHCRTCSFYPHRFRQCVQKAVNRGVTCHAIVQESSDSAAFARFLSALRGPSVAIRSMRSDDLRYMGIKDREFLFVFPIANEYVGLDIRNRKLAHYLFCVFEEMWNTATPLVAEEIDDW